MTNAAKLVEILIRRDATDRPLSLTIRNGQWDEAFFNEITEELRTIPEFSFADLTGPALNHAITILDISFWAKDQWRSYADTPEWRALNRLIMQVLRILGST